MTTQPRRIFPTKYNDLKSKLVFAMLDKGNFYPCLVIAPGTVQKQSVRVYFFQQDHETEVALNTIFCDPECFKECEVSYKKSLEAGSPICKGIVLVVDKAFSGSSTVSSFLVQGLVDGKCVSAWIPLPRVFLSKEQANILL